MFSFPRTPHLKPPVRREGWLMAALFEFANQTDHHIHSADEVSSNNPSICLSSVFTLTVHAFVYGDNESRGPATSSQKRAILTAALRSEVFPEDVVI
uniref:Uncharacterized protein n=1 Tax=Steinernema glaseri TaxID=37863 RepID=A0A1I7Z3B8_9BILA